MKGLLCCRSWLLIERDSQRDEIEMLGVPGDRADSLRVVRGGREEETAGKSGDGEGLV